MVLAGRCLWLLLATCCCWQTTLAGIPSKYSTRSQIFRWDVGLTGVAGHLAAFADFNNDKHADAILYTPNEGDSAHTDVKVFAWSKTAYSFGLLASITVPLSVVNIIPADFNYDGAIDLMIQGTSADGNLISQVYLGHVNKLTPSPCDAQILSSGQNLLFDYNADMRVDLFGVSENGTQTVWETVDFPSSNCGFRFESKQWSLSSGMVPSNQANSFVDLDGDCLADLFLPTESGSQTVFQLFINKKGSWQRNNWSGSSSDFVAPAGAGIVSFMDVDGDGNLDLVFPVCFPVDSCTQSEIHIIFNSQQLICQTSKGSDGCRKLSDLCAADPEFQMGNVRNSRDYVVVPLTSQRGMKFSSSHSVQGLNFRVQPGDINLDGYPDLLVLVTHESDGVTQSGAIAMTNVPCDSEMCSSDAIGAGRRYFQKMSAQDSGDLESIQNVFGGGFFDLDDDGTQDIVLLVQDPTTGQKSSVFLVNNFNDDAFFLKSIGLNGVCPSHCSGTAFPDPKPYGAIHPGAVTKFYVTDLNGQYLARSGVQLSQSSHGSLGAPYSMFGLGRTNNYIETFFMGFPDGANEDHWYSWSGMIPNSQILVFPYSIDNPASWTLELVISPSDSVMYVIVALIACMIALGGVIGVFHWKERQQDEVEKKKQEHFFTF
eukprot:TRINITY_DN1307_c0_g1_i2.p1 TRINITY_DN1307_c0_g1~~TRINITY_DN1307_c0_g1_i2.p1  ORF type:complete len:655 (-),score=145.73 TRINITY_DN1307_c0_g1_i2:1190-3154(-)